MTLFPKLFLLFFSIAHAVEHPPRFDGFYGAPTEQIENITQNIWPYMPYNPVIVEVGGYEGDNTKCMAQRYPEGRVITFEPNPRAFTELLQHTQNCPNVTAVNAALQSYVGTTKLYLNHGIYCNDLNAEKWSSLLESFCIGNDRFNCFRGPVIEVPCLVLDTWCKEHQIDHVDALILDTEGFELQILKSSPEILQTVIIIHTKTNLTQFRKLTTSFPELKQFLDEKGFTLLSHWYLEGLQGEATFIQTRIFDALFR
jgi:FkbM family methyltransferase